MTEKEKIKLIGEDMYCKKYNMYCEEVYERAYEIYDFRNSGKSGYTLKGGEIVRENC